MKHSIQFSAGALRDLQSIPAHLRAAVVTAIESHLAHEPELISRSRIKRLRGLSRPQYRLRVDEMRIFYDVVEGSVEVIAVIPKGRTHTWLAENSTPESI